MLEKANEEILKLKKEGKKRVNRPAVIRNLFKEYQEKQKKEDEA